MKVFISKNLYFLWSFHYKVTVKINPLFKCQKNHKDFASRFTLTGFILNIYFTCDRKEFS